MATTVETGNEIQRKQVLFDLAQTLIGTSLAIHITPFLLEPLFGSIPVNEHLKPTINGLFVLGGFLSLFTPFPSQVSSSLYAIAVAVIPVSFKWIAKYGGELGGITAGPTIALVSLLAFPIILGAAQVCRISADLQAGRNVNVVRFIAFAAFWLGCQGLLNVLSSNNHLTQKAITFIRPELRDARLALSVVPLLQLAPALFNSRIPQTQRFLGILALGLIASTSLSVLRPRPFPYTISIPAAPAPPGAPTDRPDPAIKILNSTQGLTGRIVVGQNLEYGYRFLRCDHSLLGGRWVRQGGDGKDQFGDSIFSTFLLQDAARLVYRSQPLPRQLSAEIIGLGVGIGAQSLISEGSSVNIVEIDPAVYHAARTYFGLQRPANVVLDDGGKLVQDRATEIRELGELPLKQNDYVVHDCFTGGSVPAELFTREFWWDLVMSVKTDGVVVINFAGILQSRASKAVFITLLDVFPQCRAFQDVHGMPENPTGAELVNMVIFCTMAHSPLLSFRPPEPRDFSRSRLKMEVLSNFLPHEISIAEQIEGMDSDLVLRRRKGMDQLDRWQTDSARATWEAMRKIMPVEGWLAY